MKETPGTCRWCGCSHFDPCPESCGWANRQQTLCTACINVEWEWKQQPTRRANMRRAFFRGFMVGTDDDRAELGGNPYPPRAAQRGSWERGRVAGLKEA